MQRPLFAYTDVGYSAHASTWATRKVVVYADSNDGMLHVFSADAADGGTELWAHVPTPVMSSMYLTGDKNYEHLHWYRVDGALVVADIYDKVDGQWHTLLIAGLNSGGRAYYALDITDPANPKSLWEYSNANDADLRLTYGNPVVTKRADGAWVVAFASGYNNTGKRFYGADLLGNVWRVDIDNRVLPYQSASLLAQLKVSGVPQPVTTTLSCPRSRARAARSTLWCRSEPGATWA